MMLALILSLACSVSAQVIGYQGGYAEGIQQQQENMKKTKFYFVGVGCIAGDWKEKTNRMSPKIPEMKCAYECSLRKDCKMISTKDGKCYHSSTLDISRSWGCNERVSYVVPKYGVKYPDSGVLCEGIPGDASGGTETLIASDVDSLKECSELVVKNDPSANAVTWGKSNKKCYKENGVTSISSSSKYVTCYLDVKPDAAILKGPVCECISGSSCGSDGTCSVGTGSSCTDASWSWMKFGMYSSEPCAGAETTAEFMTTSESFSSADYMTYGFAVVGAAFSLFQGVKLCTKTSKYPALNEEV